jgi:hypothetical protein
MSKEAPIDADDRWFIGERRDVRIDIVDENGAPLNVSTFGLRWQFLKFALGNSPIFIEKTSGGGGITVVNGAGTLDRVVVALQPADYGRVPHATKATYFHALWRTDGTNDRPLASGDAVIFEAGAVPA